MMAEGKIDTRINKKRTVDDHTWGSRRRRMPLNTNLSGNVKECVQWGFSPLFSVHFRGVLNGNREDK
jgi:hypothetical protein